MGIKTVTRVEQHIIKKSNEVWKLIDDYCFKSKNLYNYGNYIIRQEFTMNGNWIRYNELFSLCKDNDAYKFIGSNVGQQTLKMLDRNWKSFFASIKEWKLHPQKYKGRPKLPQYLDKENGRYVLGIDNIKFCITDKFIRFSWQPLKSLNNLFKTNVNPESAKLMLCRFVPKGTDYIMEICYEINIPEVTEQSVRIASIDLGINNFATITNNIGFQPIVINGRTIKSMNQYFNKKKGSIQSELMKVNNKHWSNNLQKLSAKRDNKVNDYIHKASKYIIDYCVKNEIDTLVCGYNAGWKQNVNIGKTNNQKFMCIPYLNFVQKLEYKCENVGIKFITVKEMNTSGTSFLDGESSTAENYDKSRRITRGLFKSNEGVIINADVNGSYQIMKQAFPNAFANGIEGVGLHPIIVNIT
jgi:putative transposase